MEAFMTTANNRLKKVVIEAVVIRADGTKEDLGKVCEINQPNIGFLCKMKKILFQNRGE